MRSNSNGCSKRPRSLPSDQGEIREATRAGVDAAETVEIAGRLLATVDERLEPGDRIIAGSILHVPVSAGDEVVVDLGQLGRAGVSTG